MDQPVKPPKPFPPAVIKRETQAMTGWADRLRAVPTFATMRDACRARFGESIPTPELAWQSSLFASSDGEMRDPPAIDGELRRMGLTLCDAEGHPDVPMRFLAVAVFVLCAPSAHDPFPILSPLGINPRQRTVHIDPDPGRPAAHNAEFHEWAQELQAQLRPDPPTTDWPGAGGRRRRFPTKKVLVKQIRARCRNLFETGPLGMTPADVTIHVLATQLACDETTLTTSAARFGISIPAEVRCAWRLSENRSQQTLGNVEEL